ncbi:hypothetical protein BC940DRAFT_290024 [Gongronella butleri]|nr:hypothetical protein BC940DRAFT_290024 [Gongronella butleri]
MKNQMISLPCAPVVTRASSLCMASLFPALFDSKPSFAGSGVEKSRFSTMCTHDYQLCLAFSFNYSLFTGRVRV